MSTAPFYDRRPVARCVTCPRCDGRVQVSRCGTAREVCGRCGHEWTPIARIERAEVR
ncbi:hypothetical protein [Streptomyces sp. ERV7]|uniref:hypothetical protein n=1 Tax=Streptomyces sp. ERV7 TaxID=1322334 RepID=UPI00131B04F5|nr:hypothetical protein [Streptomyces sp. ERV7]